MLFLYLEELRTYMKTLRSKNKSEKKRKVKKVNARRVLHSKILVKYLDRDYAETKKTLYPLLESNTITFDLLWALFKPNCIAYTDTYGNADEPRAFKVEYASKCSSFIKGSWYCVEGKYLEYDGKSYGMGSFDADVEEFKGPRAITSLNTYPIQYHADPDGIRQKLITRGQKFVTLEGMNYRFHKGMAFAKKKRTVVKVNINGRVMVDPAIFRRINPNYPISSVKPKDPDLIDLGDSDSEACSCGDDDDDADNDADDREERKRDGSGAGSDEDTPKSKWKVVKDDEGEIFVVKVEVGPDGEEIIPEKIDKLLDAGTRHRQDAHRRRHRRTPEASAVHGQRR